MPKCRRQLPERCSKFRAQEGETVEVGFVVGLVGMAGATVQSPKSKVQSQETAAAPTQAVEQTAAATNANIAAPTAQSSAATASVAQNVQETEGRSYDYQRPDAVADAQSNGGSNGSANGKSNGEMSLEELRKTKSSPLVRNIAKEHGVDIARISGSGMSGRVTKKDILEFIDSGAALRPQDLLVKGLPSLPNSQSQPSSPSSANPATQSTLQTQSTQPTSSGDRVEPMSVMRKKIASHMTLSKTDFGARYERLRIRYDERRQIPR